MSPSRRSSSPSFSLVAAAVAVRNSLIMNRLTYVPTGGWSRRGCVDGDEPHVARRGGGGRRQRIADPGTRQGQQRKQERGTAVVHGGTLTVRQGPAVSVIRQRRRNIAASPMRNAECGMRN